MQPHKIALIGAGRMGSLHGRNAAANPRFDLMAVADHSAAQAQSLAEETGSKRATVDDILGDATIETVIVASSTSSHLTNVRAAASAGKAVFCEKPLSLDAGSLEGELAELESAGVPIFVAFNRRFDPHLKELKQRLAAGEAGRIESLHIVNHDPAAPDPAFIPRSGGLFKDFTIHDFDTAAWLLEEPIVEIFATGACLVDPHIGELGDIDTAKLVLRADSGALCVISNSRRSGCGYDQRVEIFGSEGALRVDNVRTSQVRRSSELGDGGATIPYSFVERYGDAYRAELDHFADVLDGRAEPSTGPRDSLRALRLADAAERSFRERRPVSLHGSAES